MTLVPLQCEQIQVVVVAFGYTNIVLA